VLLGILVVPTKGPIGTLPFVATTTPLLATVEGHVVATTGSAPPPFDVDAPLPTIVESHVIVIACSNPTPLDVNVVVETPLGLFPLLSSLLATKSQSLSILITCLMQKFHRV
jgi:hypothetical protein